MPSQNVFDVARQQIASGDILVVTSDVFDSIVWRDVATPADLWCRLGDRLHASGALPTIVSVEDFRRGRIGAEARARQTRRDADRGEECTIEEIWAHMPAEWCSLPTADLARAELALEAATLRLHRPTVELLAHAHRCGLAVALVSDIYLSPDQLRALLAEAGVPPALLAEVHTSSGFGVGKAHGLLDHVVRSLGVEPRQVLHLGDHPIADIATAASLGARALRLSIAAAELHHPGAELAIAATSSTLGTDGGRNALVRQTLLEAGDAGTSSAYQFGAGVAGPLLAGFAGWVADTTQELGATTTHCLLREGAVIDELMRTMRPDAATRLVHASRWAMTRAAVIDGNARELDTALGRRAMLTAAHVADAFGVDADEVAAVIGPHPVHHAQRPAAMAALAADDRVRTRIVESAATIRARVMAYLRGAMDFDGTPLVVCDIGWAGTIQVSLTKILAAEGIPTPIVGLYLMLSPVGVDRVAEGHRMLGYLPVDAERFGHHATIAALTRNLELLERVTTPHLGTLLDFEIDGTPITMPVEEDHRPESLKLAQRGLVDITRHIAEFDQPAVWAHSVPFRLGLAAATAASTQAPSPEFAAVAGTWPHDDVAGAAAESLIAGGADMHLRYLNIHDAQHVEMSDIFWLPGRMALENPALRDMMSAAASGVDTELLAASNPLGAAYVAAFPQGSPVATGVQHIEPRTNAEGWSMLQLRATMPSIRVIEIRFGDRAGLVELGTLEVTVEGGVPWRVDGLGALRGRSQVHLGRKVGPSIVAVGADGHLVIYPPKPVRDAGGVLHIVVGYRGWPLDGDDRSLATTGALRQHLQRLTRLVMRIRP